MQPWCEEMYVVTLMSAFSYWLGTLFFIPKKTIRKRIYISSITLSSSFNIFLVIVYAVCILCFGVEWYLGGMQTLFTIDYTSEVKSQLSESAIPGVHYGTLLLPFIALYIIYACFNSAGKIRARYVCMLLSIILISILTKASRGDLLIILLGYIYMYSRYKKILFWHVLVFTLLVLVVLIGVMFLRVNEESIIMTTVDNPYVSILYSYIATSYANLNDFIMANHPYHWLGDASFSPLWTILGMKDSVDIIQTTQLDVFNATTYLYGFYHDYKLLGIIIFPFIIAIFVSFAYYNSLYASSLWIILLGTLQKALYVPFFGNYFCGEMVSMFPYLFTILFIMIVSKYSIKFSFK